MPVYGLLCKKCKKEFDVLCRFEERSTIRCEGCGEDGEIVPVMTVPRSVIFKQPKGTSKEDNFDYVAKWNMDNAKDVRRQAEQESKQGANPYPVIDDISSGKHFGEVK